MSFSIALLGTPGGIKKKLDEESARLTGNSKAEFDAVKPAIEAILEQQVGNGLINIRANGHAIFDGAGAKTYGNCVVHVEPTGLNVCE